MDDDYDFGDGFDFTNPVHTALLDDTQSANTRNQTERPPRKPSGCLTLLVLAATGIGVLLTI